MIQVWFLVSEYITDEYVLLKDLFMDNFMVDFSPQSLLERNWTRPRVYLIDFETAVHFPDDVHPSDRLTSGLPFPDAEYQRKRAPELLISELHPYCPFRLDMWQFGFDLMSTFSVSLSETKIMHTTGTNFNHSKPDSMKLIPCGLP